jgi:hypothetical protein
MKINNTDTASRNGLMVPNMKESTRMARSMEMDNLLLLIQVLTLDNFRIMKYPEWVSMSGLMEKCMKVNGTKTKCMVKVSLFGEMENVTKANF